MEKKKRHNATVTFSRKEQKEEMLQHLNSVQLQNLMPEEVRGKDCLKVLWAVEYLHRLAVEGKIRVQVPMYEEDSQEKQGLLDEIAQLNGKIRQLQADNKELSDLEGGYIDNINSLIKENCLFLNTVDSFQPLFFNICLSIRKKLTRSTGKS